MLPGIYIMTNKWGREGEERRQRQGEEEGREREIDQEGEKEIKRERGKGGGMEGRKEGEQEMKIALSNFIFVQCILNSFKCVCKLSLFLSHNDKFRPTLYKGLAHRLLEANMS